MGQNSETWKPNYNFWIITKDWQVWLIDACLIPKWNKAKTMQAKSGLYQTWHSPAEQKVYLDQNQKPHISLINLDSMLTRRGTQKETKQKSKLLTWSRTTWHPQKEPITKGEPKTKPYPDLHLNQAQNNLAALIWSIICLHNESGTVFDILVIVKGKKTHKK